MRVAIVIGLAAMVAGCGGPNLSFSARAGAPNSGSVFPVVDATFTPGTYSEIKLEVHKPDSTEQGVNASLADMIAAQASIIVNGTIDGAAFQFVTAVNQDQDRKSTRLNSSHLV